MPSQPFLGQVIPVPYNFAPQGWALCNGQILPISQNAALFSLLGNNFGGDGKSTFGLPNLQGRTPLVAGQGTGLSNYNVGQTGGSDSVTLNLNQLAAHSHGALAFGRVGDTNSPSGADWARPGTDTPYGTSTPPGAMSATATSPFGGSQPHENRQPFLVLNYIIALQGIFPPRQ
jgi:microcystin-dependent protein